MTRSIRLLFWTTSLLALTLLLGDRAAMSAPAFQPEQLVVGLYHTPPFVIEGDEGWDGIGIHLWRDVAEELGVTYEFRAIDPTATAESLLTGEVDVVIGHVANADDERRIDFSHAYFVSSIGTAQPAQRTLREIVGAFFAPRFWQIALWLVLAFFVVGILIWLLERRSNAEQFGQGTARGIWAGFWWAGVTMSTIGYGDKVPRTVGGRLLALLWMLVAMGITAILTASLTSILTVNSGISVMQFPGDLRRMRVGVAEQSPAAAFLRDERIQFQTFAEAQAGLEALQSNEIGIFVGDVATIRFINNEALNGTLRASATGLNPQHHVFALAADSTLREPLNRIILDRTAEPAWRNLIDRYVPRD